MVQAETCDHNETPLVITQLVSIQVLPITHVGQTTHEAIECHKLVLGESGGFFSDSLFRDDHQVHTVPTGYVSGYRRFYSSEE
jgi:hypothetical protein